MHANERPIDRRNETTQKKLISMYFYFQFPHSVTQIG